MKNYKILLVSFILIMYISPVLYCQNVILIDYNSNKTAKLGSKEAESIIFTRSDTVNLANFQRTPPSDISKDSSKLATPIITKAASNLPDGTNKTSVDNAQVIIGDSIILKKERELPARWNPDKLK